MRSPRALVLNAVCIELPQDLGFFFLILFTIFRFREREGRQKERERNVDVQKIDQQIASCRPPPGDLARNSGRFPDQE